MKNKNIIYDPTRKNPWGYKIQIRGKTYRAFKKSKTEAINEKNAIIAKLKKDGIESMSFPPEQRADYNEAMDIARLHGYDKLLSFVSAILQKLKDSTPDEPIDNIKRVQIMDAYYEYYEAKERQGRSKATLHDIHTRVKRFAEHFKTQPFAHLTQRQVENWCTQGDSSPRTQRNNFVAVHSFLKWAKRRGYHNMDLDFDRHSFLPRELKKQKTVFSIEDVRRILDVLQEEPVFRRYIPFYALQLFCGIRRAEAERMRWEYIDFANKSIRLPAEITKTGDEHIMRPPFLPDTVFAWLAPFAPSVNKTSAIAKPGESMRERINLQIGKWERNGMRHTFATMHVSLHGDPAKTAVLLRHRNQQRLWQNYLARLVTEEDAKRYFSLKPQDALINALKCNNGNNKY